MIHPRVSAHIRFEVADHPRINGMPVKMWRMQNGRIHYAFEYFHRILFPRERRAHERSLRHEISLLMPKAFPIPALPALPLLYRCPAEGALRSLTMFRCTACLVHRVV